MLDYFEAIHQHHIGDQSPGPSLAGAVLDLFQQQEQRLLQPLLDYLDGRSDVRLIGRTVAADRAPTVACVSERHPAGLLATRLADHRIMASADHFYAWRCVKALGIDPEEGVLRLSFVHYTSEDEVSQLIQALDQVL